MSFIWIFLLSLTKKKPQADRNPLVKICNWRIVALQCCCVYSALLYNKVSELCCCRCLVSKSYLTLCNPIDCSLPGSSVHEISQARILEWVAISFTYSLPETLLVLPLLNL